MDIGASCAKVGNMFVDWHAIQGTKMYKVNSDLGIELQLLHQFPASVLLRSFLASKGHIPPTPVIPVNAAPRRGSA